MLIRLIRAIRTNKDRQLNAAIERFAEYQRHLQTVSELQLNAMKTLLEEDRRIRRQEETEKVEPEFLALLWASVAFALAVGGYAAKHVQHLSIDFEPNLVNIVWLALSLGSLVFVFFNGSFAIRLTRQYAESKSDIRYKIYASSLLAGIFLTIVCAMILYLTGFPAS